MSSSDLEREKRISQTNEKNYTKGLTFDV